MNESVIIAEIIISRGSDTQIAQLCTNLTERYFAQNAQANTPYTFNWGPGGGDLNNPVKIKVGAVEYLLSYVANIQSVQLIGSCNPDHWANFQLSGQTLQYNDGSVQFTTSFQAVGNQINITVESTSNTIIEAWA